jgi:hypothetical protein
MSFIHISPLRCSATRKYRMMTLTADPPLFYKRGLYQRNTAKQFRYVPISFERGEQAGYCSLARNATLNNGTLLEDATTILQMPVVG